jgi:hypothetical protein
MANDLKITFMCDAGIGDLLSSVAFHSDYNKSEIIRACILLSIDTIQATPSLVQRVALSDRKDYRKLTR